MHPRFAKPLDTLSAPLKAALLPMLDPEQEAVKYVIVKPASDGGDAINVPDAKAALEGALLGGFCLYVAPQQANQSFQHALSFCSVSV